LETLVALQETPFAVEPISEQVQSIQEETRLQSWVDVASRWTPVAGAAIALLIFWRMLSKQKPEAVPVEMMALPTDVNSSGRLPANSQVTPEMLNALIRQKPVNVGTALREWATPAAKN
jgi:flagellar M-ring protein FliF